MDKEKLRNKLKECLELKGRYSNLLRNTQNEDSKTEAIQGINFYGGISYALEAIIEDRELFLG